MFRAPASWSHRHDCCNALACGISFAVTAMYVHISKHNRASYWKLPLMSKAMQAMDYISRSSLRASPCGRLEQRSSQRLNPSPSPITMSSQQRILVIGGTGAQGFAIVQELLSASFTVRILSRNPTSEYVQRLFAPLPQVEFHKGSFLDFAAITEALRDCYGVYVNTDGFTVNEKDELWAGVRIFEIANTIPGLRHFVFAGVDYYLQLTHFDHKYAAHHTNGKGRVSSYLQSQASSTAAGGLAWTIINTAVYDEDLMGGPLNPKIQDDGTAVFALPLGDPSGHIPLGTLRDHGIFALKVFQDRERWSGKTLNIASHFATGPEIAEAFSKATGKKAKYENVSVEEWEKTNLGEWADKPVASADPSGISNRENFRMWWPGFQDSVLYKLGTRDFGLLKEVHPELESLEGWMKRVGYDGTARPVLKGFIEPA